jgi:hypothetical protein
MVRRQINHWHRETGKYNELGKSNGLMPGSENEMQCSYCGKWIYADSPRCPKCGNYTDGLGPYRGGAEKGGRRLPRIYVIAAWLVVLCFLLPALLALLSWLRR